MYSLNTAGKDINPNMWLDACLNDPVFNEHIHIVDFMKINESVINMKNEYE